MMLSSRLLCESYVNTDSAENAYKRVIDNIRTGANVPALDYIDSRYHQEVTNGKYTYTGSKQGLKGIIDSQKDAGGYPLLQLSRAAPPLLILTVTVCDTWETLHGLDE